MRTHMEDAHNNLVNAPICFVSLDQPNQARFYQRRWRVRSGIRDRREHAEAACDDRERDGTELVG